MEFFLRVQMFHCMCIRNQNYKYTRRLLLIGFIFLLNFYVVIGCKPSGDENENNPQQSTTTVAQTPQCTNLPTEYALCTEFVGNQSVHTGNRFRNISTLNDLCNKTCLLYCSECCKELAKLACMFEFNPCPPNYTNPEEKYKSCYNILAECGHCSLYPSYNVTQTMNICFHKSNNTGIFQEPEYKSCGQTTTTPLASELPTVFITRNANVTNVPSRNETTDERYPQNESQVHYILGIVGGVLFLAIVTSIICAVVQHKRKKQNMISRLGSVKYESDATDKENPAYITSTADQTNTGDVYTTVNKTSGEEPQRYVKESVINELYSAS